MSGLEWLDRVPSRFDERCVKPVYRFDRGVIVVVPLRFRQGGPEEGEGRAGARHYLVPMTVSVPVRGSDGSVRVVNVPIISGNSIHGAKKNKVADLMMDIYLSKFGRDAGRNPLYGIYDPETIWGKYGELAKALGIERSRVEEVAALSATMFRMKPPFLSVEYAGRESDRALLVKVKELVWMNPLWRFWGLGLTSWAPNRAVIVSPALPLAREFPVLVKAFEKYAPRISKLLGVDVPAEPLPITEIAEATENEVKFKARAGTVHLSTLKVKLNRDLINDFMRLGVPVEKEKFSITVKGKEKHDVVTPTPVYLVEGLPFLPLVSVAVPAKVRSLHSVMEIASLAAAMREVMRYGVADNVMGIYMYYRFFNPDFRDDVVELAGYVGPDGTIFNDAVVGLSKGFEEWVRKTPYDEVVTPISMTLYAIHLNNIAVKKNGKK